MVIKTFRIPLLELIFLAVYALFAAAMIIDASLISLGPIKTLINYGSVGILAAILIIRSYSLKQIRFYLLFGIFIFAALTTKRTFLLVYMLLLLNARYSSFRKIVFTSLIASSLSILFVILCCKLGLIADLVYTRDGVENAHSYGFGHYSSISYFALYITLMWLYLRKHAVGWLELAALAAFNFGIYRITTTRLSFYLALFVLLLYVIIVKYRWIKTSSTFIVFLSSIGFAVCFTACVLLHYMYDPSNEILEKLNQQLNSRLLMGRTAFDLYGLKLFGQSIEMVGIKSAVFGEGNQKYFYIDSGYVYALIGYGILFTIVLLLLYTMVLRNTAKKEQGVLFIWAVTVMLFSISNNAWVSITYNPLLFYAVVPEANNVLTRLLDKLKKQKLIHIQLS